MIRLTIAFAAVALLVCSVGAATAMADEPGASVGAASVHVTVRKGDRGRAVKYVQRRLHVAVDGIFGPGTKKAVKRFQHRNHLIADGIVGPVTRQALGLRAFKSSDVRHPRTKHRSTGGGGGGGPVHVPAVLQRIAKCESGGDPKSISSDGQYRGKYQFLKSTWKANGGHGSDPAKASEREQDRVALKLYKAEGITPWPACGRQATA
jgi:hypothetical protein